MICKLKKTRIQTNISLCDLSTKYLHWLATTNDWWILIKWSLQEESQAILKAQQVAMEGGLTHQCRQGAIISE